MNNIAALDADVIAYKASVWEPGGAIDWGEGTMVAPEEATPALAKELAEVIIEDWRKMAGADSVILAISGDSDLNFRRKVHPGYKQNRTAEKPKFYGDVLQWMRENYECHSRPVLEGDDILGLLMTSSKVDSIVSTDKDIWTIPGRGIRVGRAGQFEVRNTTLLEANRFWMTQVLTGDSVDGYLGCPGVGPKKAEEVLGKAKSLLDMWDDVVRLYGQQWSKPKWRKKFVTLSPRQEALVNARCARILRAGDTDPDWQEVKLWVTP